MVTSMKNITQFLLMLTLSFYIVFAPAVAYATDPVLQKINELNISLQKQVGDKWTLSPKNSVGSGVQIGVSQSYPVAVTTTATTAAGTATNTATVTAQKVGSKIFTPTNAAIAKRFGAGVAQNLVAIGLYNLLMKSVDFVMNPENNTVQWSEPPTMPTNPNDAQSGLLFQARWMTTQTDYHNTITEACNYTVGVMNANTAGGWSFVAYDSGIGKCINQNVAGYGNAVTVITKTDPAYNPLKTKTYEEVAQGIKNAADSGNTTAQDGIKSVVGDMITNNEIDNSYFDGGTTIEGDTYNDVVNNYITNNYPQVSANLSQQDGTVVNGDTTTTTTTKDNGDGTSTKTVTTITNNTTDNTSTTNTTNTTYNNTTNNITNVTNVTNVTNITNPSNPAASTTSPTSSTSASTTTPTKPFELPAFCDWAKPVCDFIDWVKKAPEEPADDNTPFVKEDNQPGFNIDDYANKPYVQFFGECPAPPVFNIFGGQVTFPMDIVCKACEQMSWVFVAFAWLRAVMIVFFGGKN